MHITLHSIVFCYKLVIFDKIIGPRYLQNRLKPTEIDQNDAKVFTKKYLFSIMKIVKNILSRKNNKGENMNQYSLEYIERLRIHELRDYARKMGIPSPTTLRKEELLEKINVILSAKEVTMTHEKVLPHEPLDFFALLTSPDSALLDNIINQSTKSAKKKDIEVNSNGELSNTIIMRKTDVENDNTPYIYQSNDFIGLNFYIGQNEALYDQEIDQIEGYVDIHPNGYGIIRCNGFVPSNSDVYLTLALVKKYSLNKGDLVKGNVKYILENKPRVMYEIISIDGNPYVESPKFDDIPYKPLSKTFYLDQFDFDIRKGERLYCKNLPIEDAIKLAQDLIDENGVNVKFVNMNARPEEFYESTHKLTVVNCPFNRAESDLISTIELVVERIKRELENNKNNVLMIYNFSEMIRAFNVDSEGCYVFDKFNLKGINRVKNILFTAKFWTEDNHITIICMDRDDIPQDLQPIINTEIMNLFNKKYDRAANNIDKNEEI